MNRAAHALTLVLAAALFASILALRVSIRNPSEVVLVLFTVPIALLAVRFGFIGGLAGAVVSVGTVFLYARITGVELGIVGYLARAAAFLLVGGLVGYYVTQRNRFQEAAEKQFEISPDLMCTASHDGYFTRVNPAFVRSLGYSVKELLSIRYIDYVHPDDRDRTLVEAAKLNAGNDSVNFQNRYLAKDGTYHWLEWSARVSPTERTIYAAARDITDRKELEAELERLAQRDGLTGLFNRRRFAEEVGQRIQHAHRYRTGGAMLLMDVDEFKEVNDTLGHKTGDDVLQRIARFLTMEFRAVDVAARLGGDEFALLINENTRGAALRVADKILTGVRNSGKPEISLSIGIAFFDAGTLSFDAVYVAADHAMYEAKRAGGGRAEIAAADQNPAAGSAGRPIPM